jgi:hypothetical protein
MDKVSHCALEDLNPRPQIGNSILLSIATWRNNTLCGAKPMALVLKCGVHIQKLGTVQLMRFIYNTVPSVQTV